MRLWTKTDYDIQHALSIVRGYKTTLEWYANERKIILPSSISTIQEGGGSVLSDKTYTTEIKLEALRNTREYREIQAVERALRMIGSDFVRKEEKERLRKAIMTSCVNGRKYPYEYLNCDFVSRRDFYRRRRQFLLDVMTNL